MTGIRKMTTALAAVFCFTLLAALPGVVHAEASSLVRELENTFVDIADSAKPGVVHLTSERDPLKGMKEKMGERERQRLFPFNPDMEGFRAQATGSGVIMDARGYILTNDHLVRDSEKITVRITTTDGDRGKEYPGRVIGRDRATDLAVIKIEPEEPLQPISLGDSTKLKVGQWAIAIGDPFGIEKTVTVGVISGLGRSGFRGALAEVRYQNFIQTDASINQGNSGGPLLNIDGEVIGINTFIHAAAQGIGFAIPIEMAIEVYDQLVEHGEVIRGFLGVQISDLDEGMAAALKAPDVRGALVSGVFPDTPAKEAGVRHGDVIRKVDGQEIDDSKGLQNIIGHKRPGDKVRLLILRRDKEKDVTVEKEITIELMKFPEQIARTKEPAPKKEDLLGLSVAKIPEDRARPGEKGVYVTGIKPGGAADEGGLLRGDIILEVNMREVGGPKQFRSIADGLKPGQWVSFYVRRGADTLYRALKIPSDKK